MKNRPAEDIERERAELEQAKSRNVVLLESLRELDRRVREANDALMKKLELLAKKKISK